MGTQPENDPCTIPGNSYNICAFITFLLQEDLAEAEIIFQERDSSAESQVKKYIPTL